MAMKKVRPHPDEYYQRKKKSNAQNKTPKPKSNNNGCLNVLLAGLVKGTIREAKKKKW